jgi:DNA-binding transcriptional LysR family regulator
MSGEARALNNVDLNLLKALDVLLQERSVTRAADRLALTQPTMSAALRRLRALFDDELLLRDAGGMQPTPLAESLAPTVRRIVGEIEDLVVPPIDFDPVHDTTTFSVLATDYAAVVLIQPLMAALATEAPHVRIALQSISPAVHQAALQSGESDIAIVPSRFSHSSPLPQHALFTDRFVAVAWKRNHRAREPLTFAQFEELPYLSYKLGPVLAMVDETLLGLDRPRQPDTIVSSFLLGAFMLRGTSQVTFLQTRLAEKLKGPAELKLLTPPFPSPTVTETMTWHPRNDQKPAHRWLRTRMLALAGDVLGPPIRVP